MFRLCPLLFAALLGSAALQAQSGMAALRIEVRDASGAPVEAAGWIESTSTGLQRRVQSNEQGIASIADLTPGTYRVVMARPGFQESAATISLGPAETITHAVTLVVGAGSYEVTVVSATPLPGLERPLEEIPAPAQTATARDLEDSGAVNLATFVSRRMNNVYLNEVQGNPMQPDLNYRGYTASPLLGTPQGISIYLDGVRLNQPFGDVVSWDLVPRIAISEMTLIPGSNPLFGLNTLGGALSVRTKDGLRHPGSALQLQGGSFGRKMADFENGGSLPRGFHWFVGGSLFFEDGWREASSSNVRQLFGRPGWQGRKTALAVTMAYANNALNGNGLQEKRLLERDRRSVYTFPDVTANRAPFANLTLRHALSDTVSLSANGYFRYIGTRIFNGDMNEDSLDQSVYQPNAAERAALAAAGYTGFPTAGENAANTPFPRWRCIAHVLLRDEPVERCNGLLNRASVQQRNYGVSGQISWFPRGRFRHHQLTAGAGYDGNNAGFVQSTELGYLNPDRTVTGTGAYGDGINGGEADGVPFDARVHLSSRVHSASIYATDALTISKLSLTFSGRYNHTVVDNLDRIRPAAGTGSLTGRHTFQRFNPAAGATYRLAGGLSVYGSYTEGSRAPTAIELGCADPDSPCRLPNAMAGDPPLKQVRTRSWEAGLRGSGERWLQWTAGWFHAANHDDILFVASGQTGYGYFRNFEETRREGLELDASARWGRAVFRGGYVLLHATFQSREEVNGTGNSTNDLALRARPGLEGRIAIEPGNTIPLTPRHMGRAETEVRITQKLQFDVGMNAVSRSLARGNENNRHKPDGVYYLGEGYAPGYAVVNLGVRYSLHPRVQLLLRMNNALNARYVSAAQLGRTGLNANGAFVARPFPSQQGAFPIPASTFYAPGAPRGAWAGLRFRF
jgi:outer membrane receptor protein involved in Fe transport